MSWVAVDILAGPGAAEPVAAALMTSGSSGIAMLAADRGQTPDPASPTRVRGYFRADGLLDATLADLRERVAILTAHSLDIEERFVVNPIREEDWETAWKAHYKPLRIGRQLVVKPGWEPYAASADERVIELDPGMAFGTGTHPTTVLCLESLEDQLRRGERIVDWGTGSGILAIAAARLGAARVLALDSDPVAVRAAEANIRRNRVASRVRVVEGDLPSRGEFDGIVANILAEPVIVAAPSLRARTGAAGWLIVSGISDGRAEEVVGALVSAGFRRRGTLRREGWVCLTLS